ncbi:MAG: hypothetical protein AAF447_17990 [Myxococcota bacterium]
MTLPRLSDAPTPSVRLETSEPRATAVPSGRQFRDTLASSARGLVRGVESAAALLPGGPVVAAAVSGPGGASAVTGAPGASTGADLRDALGAHATSSLELLALQQEVSAEQRSYMATSKVMKARHDGAKNAIGNLR